MIYAALLITIGVGVLCSRPRRAKWRQWEMTALIPQLWSPESIRLLQEKIIMPRLVRRGVTDCIDRNTPR